MGIFAELKKQEAADEAAARAPAQVRQRGSEPAKSHPASIRAEPPTPEATATDAARVPATPTAAAPAVAANHGLVFDLATPADKTNTYSFSKDELWAIHDMVQELDRQFDIQVTRYNLMRLAVHFLVDDFRRNKEQSFAYQRLRRPKK